ncbi:hypothetical protein LAZ40_06935 [Cereibacter sphaeroides]|uniref:hypothetical protein n=1 Tax=Cereibacter sphaeroides TaxID=1063 RepID=UPI001F3244A8|nr:hypothetical protein [Cereibacter sphaeroides]MCE6958782.1 hypothetical protein [Cereibacter sphaeroides]MCE6973344.1 hypothetical protein [Cereibacter sphaeroides]
MMLVTGIYLCFEVAFAARLLDVVSSTTDLARIEQMENAGRVISGVALTLVVWSVRVLPRLRRLHPLHPAPRLHALFSLAASALLCCAISYGLQEAILRGITAASDAEQRRAAATLTLVASSVQDSHATLKGIDFDEAGRDSPEIKTFMALLPALALATDNLDERVDGQLRILLRARIDEEGGGFRAFYNEIYIPASDRMAGFYNSWLDALDRRAQALSRAGRKKSARAHVQRMYEREMDAVLGFVPDPDLSQRAFFRRPEIQEIWRQRSGSGADAVFEPGLSAEEARIRLYEPMLDDQVERRHADLVAPVDDFGPGHRLYRMGNDAIRAAWVPLVAFGFSLLGAMVHTFKTANFAVMTLTGLRSPRRRRLAKIAGIGMAAAVVVSAATLARDENAATRSDLFGEFETLTSLKSGPSVASAMRAVIQLQPHVWPIAERIRVDLLQGFTFDFDPDTPTPLFER